MLLADFSIEFSYFQFLVYDANVSLPGNESTELHYNQGFARRDSSVCFRTLLQFGHGQVQVFDTDYELDGSDERVIKVPFYCPSGKVLVEGPEENETHSVEVKPGHYELTAAERTIHEKERLSISLHFFGVGIPLTRSKLIVRDSQLDPPDQLLESAETAMF